MVSCPNVNRCSAVSPIVCRKTENTKLGSAYRLWILLPPSDATHRWFLLSVRFNNMKSAINWKSVSGGRLDCPKNLYSKLGLTYWMLIRLPLDGATYFAFRSVNDNWSLIAEGIMPSRLVYIGLGNYSISCIRQLSHISINIQLDREI